MSIDVNGPMDMDTPLLTAEGLTKFYGARLGCRDIGFDSSSPRGPRRGR